jgi:ATP-binding cassette subfamily F protein 3
LGKAYGDNQVFDGVDYLVTAGSKIAFVGRNGEGKSTMAKIIVGELVDYTGTFKLGHQVQIGYYAQNQAAMLDGEKTVFQTIDDAAVGDIRPKIRNILGSFLFDNDDIDKKVKVLSGGEKARLALAKLLLTPCNLLVLDEPTNHLDMDSKDILKNALLQYTGTLIVVSHDRDFLQGLTDSLFEFREGGVHEFKGDIFEFLDYRKMEHLKELDNVQKKRSSGEAQATVSQNKLNYQQSKERERELRKLRGNVSKIEKEIAEIEERIAQKEALLSGGDTASQGADFFSEYQSMKEELEAKMSEWEEASVELELMENR